MIRRFIQPLNHFVTATLPPPSRPTNNKKVSFDAAEKTIPTPSHHSIQSEEDIKTRWYSKRELAIGCREAKQIVSVINSVNGNWNAIDHSQICIVGLEKFHGKKERDTNKKLLIQSVLIRQQMNRNLGMVNDTNSLNDISSMISASFKEFARWQAAMHMFKPMEANPPPMRRKPSMHHHHHRCHKWLLVTTNDYT